MSADRTLVDLLGASVDERGAHEAIVAAGRRVTYTELWTAVGRGAAFLRAHGLEAGDRVALLMRNSPEYAAAYYAVLAAGGVVVPLNQEAKARDLAAFVRHADARIVIADEKHPERAPLAGVLGSQVRIADATAVLAHEAAPVDRPTRGAERGDRLASILYTSGTTGEPKGVMLSHRNLASNVLSIVEYLRLTPADRLVAALPFFYSYGNSILHTHLAVGATLILEAGLMYPQKVVETIRDERATGFSGVPWMFLTLLNRTAFATMSAEHPDLRYFTQAGAAMAPADVERMRSAFPRSEFYVMYGQTEATARLTYLPPAEARNRTGSVGRPIPGVRIEVRRPDGSIASTGETGEVHAAGPNIMLGYWNAPEATREAIVEDSGGRWLRTGDLGQRDADGFLFLVGRSSEIIKTGDEHA